MTLIDEVYAHARILAPQMNGECQAMLEAMCRSTTVSLLYRTILIWKNNSFFLKKIF